MSAIIKFHTRKSKNNLLQHSSCSVQTQDYQISLKTRNIFCVAFKACLTDVRAGEGAAPGAERAPIPAHPAHTCSHKAQQNLCWALVYSEIFVVQMVYSGNGCCSLDITEAAARPGPAEHRSLYWCYWEKQLQSECYFCRADRNASSEIFLTQIFLTVLCITNISIITHVQKILHCCKTSKKSALNLSEEMHQFRLSEGCQALCLQ